MNAREYRGSDQEQRKGYSQSIMQTVEACIKGKGWPKVNLQMRWL